MTSFLLGHLKIGLSKSSSVKAKPVENETSKRVRNLIIKTFLWSHFNLIDKNKACSSFVNYLVQKTRKYVKYFVMFSTFHMKSVTTAEF